MTMIKFYNSTTRNKVLCSTNLKASLCFLIFGFLLPTLGISQQTYTFTSAAATSSVGPTQAQLNTAYLATNLNGSVVSVGGKQTFTVPNSGLYLIDISGAAGGDCPGYTKIGGYGARMQGQFNLLAGNVLTILIGQRGENGCGNAGGGGATYVVCNGTLLIAAGGGGGCSSDQNGVNGATVTSGTADNPPVSLGGAAGTGGLSCQTSSYNGGGGGGYLFGLTGNGQDGLAGGYGGISFLNGGTGGAAYAASGCPAGGFGGGGGGRTCTVGGGGGGGYSGGAGGQHLNTCVTNGSRTGGGGGGSYNIGASQVNTVGYQTGAGRMVMTSLCNVNVYSSGTNSIAPSICVGQSLTLTTDAVSGYTWSTGNTTNTAIVVSPGTTTTYSVIGTSSANCVASSAITIIVSAGLPVLSITTSTNNLCLGKSATVTASGALSYTWTGGLVNAQSFTPAVTSSYTVSGQNGCGTSTAVTTITVAPLPVTAIVSPTSVCAGSTATLTAASAVTGYTWSPGPLIGITAVVGPIANTVYTVIASDGICAGTATVSLSTKPVPTVAVVTSATVVCDGAAVTLTASGAISYSWTTPANTTGSVVTANTNGPTLYQVIGTNAVGCNSSANQVVLTNPSPTVNITTNKTIACPGDAVNLMAGGTGATSYAWTNGPATAANNVNPAFTTVYVVTGTGLGCSTTKSISIAVINASVSAVTSNTGICNGGSATITASGANTYLWVGFVPGASAIVTPTASTVYTVNAVTTASSVSCPSTANINITVFTNPTISIAATKTVMCKADSGPKLTAGGAVTYTWSNNATTSTVNVAPTITANTYTVNGTDANGCVNSSVITIKVNTCTGINGIAVNDKALVVYPNPSNGEFTITGDADITLKIMNELGQEVSIIKLSSQNDHKVSVSHLANGIYFIVGQNENGKVNQKIIVSN